MSSFAGGETTETKSKPVSLSPEFKFDAEAKSPRRKIQISLPALGREEWLALQAPLETGWLTQGPAVAEFEKEFASRHGVEHALAVTSCTTGLHLALMGLGIGPGDEVIVPSFTWVASANAVLYCGGTPVLVDVDPLNYLLDFDDLSRKLTSKTKAVMPVHLFGLCVDPDELRRRVGSSIKIVEDAACAVGATWNGKSAGSLGDVGVFSFHPRKIVTTGEGGMVTTNSHELFGRMATLRNHGASLSEEARHSGPRPYLLPEFDVVGFNYRMTDLQGALGRVQLGRLNGFLEERRKWAAWYTDALKEFDWIGAPQVPSQAGHSWQAYVCMVDASRAPLSRNDLLDFLEQNGISSRPGTHAVHALGYYKNTYGLSDADFPGATQCAKQTLALPLHNRMTREDYDYVLEILRQVN